MKVVWSIWNKVANPIWLTMVISLVCTLLYVLISESNDHTVMKLTSEKQNKCLFIALSSNQIKSSFNGGINHQHQRVLMNKVEWSKNVHAINWQKENIFSCLHTSKLIQRRPKKMCIMWGVRLQLCVTDCSQPGQNLSWTSQF